MTPFSHGYNTLMKTAGMLDEIQDARRAARGEKTDLQMQIGAVGTGVGAAMAPLYAERVLGLSRTDDMAGKSLGAKLKNFYTGSRLPTVAMEDLVQDVAKSGTPDPRKIDALLPMLEGSTGSRAKAVLSRAVSDFPQYAKRHPFLLGLGALGAVGTANSANDLGRGIYERYFGGADQGIRASDAGVALGTLGALGLAGGGVVAAHRAGMLPKIHIEMPQRGLTGEENERF